MPLTSLEDEDEAEAIIPPMKFLRFIAIIPIDLDSFASPIHALAMPCNGRPCQELSAAYETCDNIAGHVSSFSLAR